MREIFRWIDKDGGIHEYRFTNNVCDGFFSNGIEAHQEQNYKGRLMDVNWREGLKLAGFDLLTKEDKGV